MLVKSYDFLNHSPGFRLAIRGWAELVEDPATLAELTMGYDNKTIVAFKAGEPIGVIVWSRQDHIRDAFIVLGYVAPKHRKAGVYSALYQKLKELAQADGLRSITGATSWTNDTMRAVAAKQGRRPVAVTLREDL